MAGKSVKEMSTFRRNWHSLSAVTFRMVLVLSLLISIAAIAFGYYLYQSAVSMDQYRQAWLSSDNGAASADLKTLRQLSDTITFMYERVDRKGISPVDEKGKINDEYIQYFKKYERLNSYKKAVKILSALKEELGTSRMSYCLLDKEKSRVICLADVDASEKGDPAGWWRAEENGEIEAYIEGTSPGWLAEMMGDDTDEPVYISKADGTCRGAKEIFETDRYICVSYAVFDRERATETGKQFLVQYIIMMLFCVLLISVAAALFFRRRTAMPAEKMAKAANKAAKGSKDKQYFGKLDIKTGDEIEDLSLALQSMEKEAQIHTEKLKTATANHERTETEADIASLIRSRILPDEEKALSDLTEAKVCTYMRPSKKGGGDFYDCFRTDPDHIGLVIGEVEGSGVPAAIASMTYELVLRTLSVKGRTSPAEILGELNDRICDDSDERMAANIWLGILELSTGILKASSAGHGHPVLRKGEASWCDISEEKQGVPVGREKETLYNEYEIELEPGDQVFLYSEGITQTAGAEEESFGHDRLIDSLNEGFAMSRSAEGKQMSPEFSEEEVLSDAEPKAEEDLRGLMQRVAEGLEDFAGSKELHDDITMMCIGYLGGSAGSSVRSEPNMFAGISAAETGSRIKLAATTENYRTAFHFIERHLMQVDCPFGIQKQILIAAQEVYANIAGYAYAPDTGNVDIDIRITEDGSVVKIMFIDTGVEFDPLVNEDPDPSGGMGLFIVKKLMDSVSYSRENGKNIFSMEKRIREPEII